jgi:ribosome maturation factor RimP
VGPFRPTFFFLFRDGLTQNKVCSTTGRPKGRLSFMEIKMEFQDGTKKAQLQAIAEEAVKDNFLELFELKVRPQGKKLILTVAIDRKSGPVTLDDCTAVSRDLEKRLDEMDLIETPYLLEVTSPGLDRPLRGLEDCARFKGRMAHLVLKEPVGGQTDFRGRLAEVKEGQVELVTGQGRAVWLSFSLVKRANLEIEI